jgi:hypothetical protein
MNYSLPALLIVIVLLTAGCTNAEKNPVATPTPTVSQTQVIMVSQTTVIPVYVTPTVTLQPMQDSTDDSRFLDAVNICYNKTPVISDVKTNLDFTICMQHTPVPSGACAQRFRSEILKYTTKDDDTTAGYNRETGNMKVARMRFSDCLGVTY